VNIPLPETDTWGRDSRLVGGSWTVLVGEAVTAPMAARAERRAKDFMFAQEIHSSKENVLMNQKL
jgi:hypothetical protein